MTELPRVLSRAQAAALGLSPSHVRHQVARGRWQSPAPGVVATFSGSLSRNDWISVGLAAAPADALVSGWDGAILGGVIVTPPSDARVVILTRQVRARTLGPVLIRRSERPTASARSSSKRRDLALIPITSVARSVADAALDSTWDGPVIDLVTAALRDGRTSHERLAAELEAGPRAGSARLRRVLGDVGRSESVAEYDAAKALRRSKAPAFEQNAPVRTRYGKTVRVDFLWRSIRAVVEIDSWKHHGTHRTWLATMDRHARLTASGYAVIHVAPSVVAADPLAWADSVCAWLVDRATEVGAGEVGPLA